MTREQQRLLKEQKLAAKKQAKIEYKQDKQDHRAWNKMVNMAKNKGAWIEDEAHKIVMCFSMLFIVIVTHAQDCVPSNYFYMGAGGGASNKNAIVHLNVGYNTNIIGIEGSMIAHIDNRNPAMFNGQLVKSIYDNNRRFTFMAGASYLVTTFDKVGGTKVLPIVGMEWASMINYSNALITIRGQVTGDNFCLMVGLQGIFKSNKN